MRVSERAHLRRQIPILVFGFLKPFEVVWRHVLVARGQNADVVVFPPTRLTLSYKIIVRLTSVLKSKNLSSGFSDRIENDPADQGCHYRSKNTSLPGIERQGTRR